MGCRPDILHRITTLVLLATTIGLWLAAGRTGFCEEKRNLPNFVVILIDDMGYGDIGPYGSKLNRTPVLDRMAAEGMKLTSFYAAPVCTPSRAQMMTGCYAKRVSLPNVLGPVSRIGIGSSERTVADLLRQQGYATMCIGKWHLGDQPEFLPTRHGFDHYLGLPYSNDMGGSGKPGDRRPPVPLVREQQVVEAPVQQDKLVERYTAEAVKFITANKDRPFFLYLPHTAVHVPIHPGKAFQGKSANGRYGDWVEEVDWSTGRVLDTLRSLKLDGRTLVLFTSDNGPWRSQGKDGGVAGPLRGGKASTWEGGVREPTHRLVAGQDCRRHGLRCDDERDGRAADAGDARRRQAAWRPRDRRPGHLAAACRAGAKSRRTRPSSTSRAIAWRPSARGPGSWPSWSRSKTASTRSSLRQSRSRRSSSTWTRTLARRPT